MVGGEKGLVADVADDFGFAEDGFFDPDIAAGQAVALGQDGGVGAGNGRH